MVSATAPCTVGNFGPGFDVLSLALARPGDTVALAPAAADRVRVDGPGASDVPVDWKANCATRALDLLRAVTGLDAPLEVRITKGVPPGSGLGSSASSAAAAVKAFAKLNPGAVDGGLALDAAAEGEAAASPGHRDDVAAALFGGLAIVGPGPRDVRRVPTPPDLRLAVVRPHVALETRRMRALVPREPPLATLIANLSAVARLVDACHRGDVPALGRAVDGDTLARVARGPHVPGFEAAREAALAAGAHGYCISGSGPASLAVCAAGTEEKVLHATASVYRGLGVACDAFTCNVAEVDDAIPLP